MRWIGFLYLLVAGLCFYWSIFGVTSYFLHKSCMAVAFFWFITGFIWILNIPKKMAIKEREEFYKKLDQSLANRIFATRPERN